ncbi:MAG: hypothetical protein K5839_03645 [Treponemataceae bacterium]|nr:hypothetical protein [Treponemataceae bacterium]
MKRIFSLILISLIFSIYLTAQNSIAFFAAVSLSEDISTINLAEDLYFSKASLIPDINVIDFRSKTFNKAEINKYDANYIFYPEIQENGEGWICIFHGINTKTKEETIVQRNYDSYYKILMEAKNELEDFFTELKSSDSYAKNDSSNSQTNVQTAINLESLSGVWRGEKFIDKIVILRGGRGFVIYQNGASMNITVSIEDGNLVAKQISSSNASYFPEISRDEALKLAPDAEPIVWKMKLIDSYTLEGMKRTLQEFDSKIDFNSIPVTWKKVQ